MKIYHLSSCLTLILTFFLFLLTSCASIPAEKQCSLDDECAAVECCHGENAVNKNFAPDCSKILCTSECVPNTLDCGQGEVKCVKGECKAVIN